MCVKKQKPGKLKNIYYSCLYSASISLTYSIQSLYAHCSDCHIRVLDTDPVFSCGAIFTYWQTLDNYDNLSARRQKNPCRNGFDGLKTIVFSEIIILFSCTMTQSPVTWNR